MKKSILILFALFFSITIIQAQEVIPASGGNATGSGGSVSYTIGQIVYSTNSGTNGSVAEGVQQPYEISEATSIEEARDISLICTAFPNPTNDFLTLKIDASTTLSIQTLSYQLYDISGKLIEKKKISSNETIISSIYLVSGVYFLKVIDKNKEIKTFKIVKNH
ncbi:MAG: T9SS type A sorting domain-containing protein [Bacteroidetes bacterium]|nr:T9SS type A sorting domain-containing protein [Bacteroidota bacterium]